MSSLELHYYPDLTVLHLININIFNVAVFKLTEERFTKRSKRMSVPDRGVNATAT